MLCVGHAAFDITFTVDHHPGADEKCSASSAIFCGGGPAANAAVTVARLGGASALAGYLGKDPYGDQHHRELLEEGVVTDYVVRGSQLTPLSIILAKPGGERTVVNYRTQASFLSKDAVDFSRCRSKVILFDGHEPLASLPLARSAVKRRTATVLDAGSVHRGTVELVPHTDYLVASAAFARDFSSEDDPARALEKLSQLAPFVVITRGKDGLLWKSDSGVTGSMRAFAVDAVDTTGAGDTFHGAFALGVARGMEFTDNLRYASAAAALCCTRLGARVGIPTRPEVEALALAH